MWGIGSFDSKQMATMSAETKNVLVARCKDNLGLDMDKEKVSFKKGQSGHYLVVEDDVELPPSFTADGHVCDRHEYVRHCMSSGDSPTCQVCSLRSRSPSPCYEPSEEPIEQTDKEDRLKRWGGAPLEEVQHNDPDSGITSFQYSHSRCAQDNDNHWSCCFYCGTPQIKVENDGHERDPVKESLDDPQKKSREIVDGLPKKRFVEFLESENHFMASNYLCLYQECILDDETMFSCLASEDRRLYQHYALHKYALAKKKRAREQEDAENKRARQAE